MPSCWRGWLVPAVADDLPEGEAWCLEEGIVLIGGCHKKKRPRRVASIKMTKNSVCFGVPSVMVLVEDCPDKQEIFGT